MRTSMLCALAVAVTSTVAIAQTTTPVTTENKTLNQPVVMDRVTTQTVTGSDNAVITDSSTAVIPKPTQDMMVANVLCQNIPAVPSSETAVVAYANYIDQVSELFANNSRSIKSNTIGINNDHQMSYTLNSPINVVGIVFNTVNVNTLKDTGGNYYQIMASKPLTQADMGLIKNIPQDNKLTVSTLNQRLDVICNVKVPVVKK